MEWKSNRELCQKRSELGSRPTEENHLPILSRTTLEFPQIPPAFCLFFKILKGFFFTILTWKSNREPHQKRSELGSRPNKENHLLILSRTTLEFTEIPPEFCLFLNILKVFFDNFGVENEQRTASKLDRT